MVRIFRELEILLKNGQFTKKDVDFMEAFLGISLKSTKNLKKRIKEQENEQGKN